MMQSNGKDASMILVGNSLAVLVAATERARLGLRTTVVNPGGPLGGYFAGLQVMGRRCDAGMVLYEFSSFREELRQPSLDSYDPMRRNDVGRFCGVVRQYVQSKQHTRTVAAPRMWIDGRWLPDMMLGNGIEAMIALDPDGSIRRELRLISQRVRHDTALWHPANKSTWPLDGGAPPDWNTMGQAGPVFDCDTVSRRVHGETLHQHLFLRFAQQVLNRDASHMAALYHRLPWLPFYWPQTLLAMLEGEQSPLAPTLLSHPENDTVAALCGGMAAQLRQDPLITLIEDRPRGLRRHGSGFALMLERSGMIDCGRLGWALTPGQGLALAGESASPLNNCRLPLVLGFFRLLEDQVEGLDSFGHVLGDRLGIYRVTNSSGCGAPAEDGLVQLVVEANPQRFFAVHGPLAGDEAIARAMLGELQQIGVFKPRCKGMPAWQINRFEGALPLPSHEAVRHFVDDQSRLRRLFPEMELIGASAAPFAMGLSDQIVQGLQLAHRGITSGMPEFMPLVAWREGRSEAHPNTLAV